MRRTVDQGAEAPMELALLGTELVAGIAHGDLQASSLPAVSFVTASGYQDGHAAYSDPLNEQQFLTREINALMKTPDWRDTAAVISYDDSDGWYDHAYSGVTNPSQTVADALTGPGQCGTGTPPLAGQGGRCGYGPRLPWSYHRGRRRTTSTTRAPT